MFCAFHPTNAASANCSGCNRPLCPACDHRIKGHPNCEDCIVKGVDILRRGGHMVSPPVSFVAPPPSYRPAARPWRATLLALVPGLGAIYNRQTLKALVHFLVVAGLMQTAEMSDIGFFGFSSVVFYLYTILDANRT